MDILGLCNLHETYTFYTPHGDKVSVLKVSDGWIYTISPGGGLSPTSTFVPEVKE